MGWALGIRHGYRKKGGASLDVVVHAFNASTWEAETEAADLCKFKATLVYIVSPRPAEATQRLCLNKQTKTNKQTIKQTSHIKADRMGKR